jgi:transcriptional regulator GlxA family with amidase domain
MTRHEPESVAVVAFDGISPFHLSVPCLVFGEDRRPDGSPRFRLRVCAAEPGPLRTNAGFDLVARGGLGALRTAGIVVIPSWRDDGRPAPPSLLRELRAAHKRGALIVGLCLGAFVLAEAGLLDGRPATTHWHLVPVFRELYPSVQLQPEVLYVDDGDVITSAGTAAGLDCCLHVLRKRFGAEAANRAARRMVVAPHRQGGQAQYIAQPVPARAERDRLRPVLEWMSRHLAQPQGLDDLARRALMSRRTFTRHFRDATGTTVVGWLKSQRLALAQRLLEVTDLPIEQVAEQAGFGSTASLRQHFAQALRTSPLAYRRQFAYAAAVD